MTRVLTRDSRSLHSLHQLLNLLASYSIGQKEYPSTYSISLSAETAGPELIHLEHAVLYRYQISLKRRPVPRGREVGHPHLQ
jgi:hypothetical protein